MNFLYSFRTWGCLELKAVKWCFILENKPFGHWGSQERGKKGQEVHQGKAEDDFGGGVATVRLTNTVVNHHLMCPWSSETVSVFHALRVREPATTSDDPYLITNWLWCFPANVCCIAGPIFLQGEVGHFVLLLITVYKLCCIVAKWIPTVLVIVTVAAEAFYTWTADYQGRGKEDCSDHQPGPWPPDTSPSFPPPHGEAGQHLAVLPPWSKSMFEDTYVQGSLVLHLAARG